VPRTRVYYYRDGDGKVPMNDWLARLPSKALAKCLAYLARLQSEGHELRRPIADYLRDGIHELRPNWAGVHYRLLYFFHGNDAVVVSHGLMKEGRIPGVEIDRAVERMNRFKGDPGSHLFDPARGG
jgi:phage-related protein